MTRRIEPGPNQESVWDYPRPPAIEPVEQRLRVVFNGETIADTTQAYRILETSHPPTYYLPPGDIEMDYLHRLNRTSMCEYKGRAVYYDITVGDRTARQAAWAYPSPRSPYAVLEDHVSFYASKMDACFVGEEEARAQEGDFYGGWITDSVVGPFKGGAGTIGW
ncbi:hypothetical protein CRI94_06040 [Longibacter salinarum]|uniref:DUF427 domain-containing protein n=1 Tax=Longibacter salinarum TaxID=1850348 RepID=A0A2A8D0S6_9BACT|nr:DUF427 domain-containing protein [Longibacter salinarum]PEN14579.1 hypothetical protein CRI94_06040 [Longibacter salinarum]